jgi:hypothetical protein
MDRGSTVLARVKSVKKHKNKPLSVLDIEVMVM